MDLDAYVAEHRGEWRRLAFLSGRRKLTAGEADELVLLYQRVATHLSVVRSRTPDPALVAELSRLVLAARSALTGPSRFNWSLIPEFFAHGMPLAFYRARWWWVACGLSFYAIATVVGAWVVSDPEVVHAFGITDEEVDNMVNGAFVGYYSEFMPQNFGLQVWTNNSFLAAMCLASGLLVVPPLFMIWNEAVRIGLVGGVMVANGEGGDFFGYIIPHGLLELTAIFVAAGIGMRMGWAWIEPGPVLTRAQSLAAAVRQGMVGALGLVVVLAVSALLEAFITPAPFPLIVRDLIGFVVWAGFLVYVWVVGGNAARRSEPAGGLESQIGVGDLTREGVGGTVQDGHTVAAQR